VEDFHFQNDVLPKEFVGLLEKKKRVIVVDSPTPEAVKEVIDKIAAAGSGATASI
jgi:threonine synthase